MIRTIFAIVSVILLCALFQTSPVDAQDVVCNPDGNGREISACVEDEHTKSDAEMNAAYKKKLALEDNETAKSDLRDAQRAWIKFRDKTCNFEVGPMPYSGSGWGIALMSCLTKMTKQRTDTLNKYIACTGSGSCR